jgi:hypothetical protein
MDETEKLSLEMFSVIKKHAILNENRDGDELLNIYIKSILHLLGATSYPVIKKVGRSEFIEIIVNDLISFYENADNK